MPLIKFRVRKKLKLRNKIDTSELRTRHGLETDSGSMYSHLRQQGLSDNEAQERVFKSRGLM